jgi:acyl dehydratase
VTAYADATGDRVRDGIAPPMVVVLASIVDGVLPTVVLPEVIGDEGRLLRLLHGEEEIVWSGVVRCGDRLTTVATLEASEEKGSGELLAIGTRIVNQRDEQVARTRSSLMIRDGKPTSIRALREEIGGRRERTIIETFTASWRVAEDQPDRYARASGDHNPIHLDDAAARKAGLRGRILHGMCTMAFAQRTVVDALAAGDPRRLASLKVRFTKPVYPGDTLTCAGGLLENGEGFGLEVRNQDGQVVLRDAVAIIR